MADPRVDASALIEALVTILGANRAAAATEPAQPATSLPETVPTAPSPQAAQQPPADPVDNPVQPGQQSTPLGANRAAAPTEATQPATLLPGPGPTGPLPQAARQPLADPVDDPMQPAQQSTFPLQTVEPTVPMANPEHPAHPEAQPQPAQPTVPALACAMTPAQPTQSPAQATDTAEPTHETASPHPAPAGQWRTASPEELQAHREQQSSRYHPWARGPRGKRQQHGAPSGIPELQRALTQLVRENPTNQGFTLADIQAYLTTTGWAGNPQTATDVDAAIQISGGRLQKPPANANEHILTAGVYGRAGQHAYRHGETRGTPLATPSPASWEQEPWPTWRQHYWSTPDRSTARGSADPSDQQQQQYQLQQQQHGPTLAAPTALQPQPAHATPSDPTRPNTAFPAQAAVSPGEVAADTETQPYATSGPQPKYAPEATPKLPTIPTILDQWRNPHSGTGHPATQERGHPTTAVARPTTTFPETKCSLPASPPHPPPPANPLPAHPGSSVRPKTPRRTGRTTRRALELPPVPSTTAPGGCPRSHRGP